MASGWPSSPSPERDTVSPSPVRAAVRLACKPSVKELMSVCVLLLLCSLLLTLCVQSVK